MKHADRLQSKSGSIRITEAYSENEMPLGQPSTKEYGGIFRNIRSFIEDGRLNFDEEV
jgi:hypothetical protein